MVKILVLEDNVLSQDLLCSLLIPEGYEVVCAADGQSGLVQIQEQHPDLAISDIDMPGMNGLEVLQQIRLNHLTASLPVIICTSAEDESCRRLATQLNAIYITKPFYPSKLLQIVTEQLTQQLSSSQQSPF